MAFPAANSRRIFNTVSNTNIPISPPDIRQARSLDHRDEGSFFDADHPATGVPFPRRSTTEGFRGTLFALAQDSDRLVEETAAGLPPFVEPEVRTLPAGIAETANALLVLLKRLDRAIAFANWRKAHATELGAFLQTVRRGDEGSPNADRAIGSRLKTLLSIVESVAPLNQAGVYVSRIETGRAERGGKVDRIAQCGRAVTALQALVPLGTLAQAQVDSLRSTLQTRSDHWRSAMYQNATTYAPDLTGTVMDAKGMLGLQVGRDGVNAPAQHISNASALRGALLGFFLAFREHVLQQRGGLTTLVLDDPQELLDNDTHTGRWALDADQLHLIGGDPAGNVDDIGTITQADLVSFTITNSDGSTEGWRRCARAEIEQPASVNPFLTTNQSAPSQE